MRESGSSTAPIWNLESALDSYGGAAMLRSQLHRSIHELSELYDRVGIDVGPPLPFCDALVRTFEEVVNATDSALEAERLLGLYHAGMCWYDANDQQAAVELQEVQQELVPLAVLRVRLELWAARLPLDALTAKTPSAASHRRWLERCAEVASRRLTPGEEELVEQLRPSGQGAWRQLHEALVGQLTVTLDGETIPLSMLRGRMEVLPATRRQNAHSAVEEAWGTIEMPAAACLNAVKGETLVLSRRRGWNSPLEECLDAHGIDMQVLDAVHAALQQAVPHLHRFARIKAQLFGHNASLPWWDIAAPLPNEIQLRWTTAVELTIEAFQRFSPALAAHADRALTAGWVDAQVRPGKRSTALCMPMKDGASRLMVSFDGSYDSMFSLAHEFGHSYHYMLLGQCTELQRASSLSMQETASLWCESLLLDVAAPGSAMRAAVLNASLIGIFQTLVDVHSRYLFERELFRRRAEGLLTPSELNTLAVQAQHESYGDCVPVDTLPRRVWIARPHLYNSTFGNWPYYFGLLLGFALFTNRRDGSAALDEFLRRTGTHTPADLVADLGGEITSPKFWMAAVTKIEEQVDEFTLLIAHDWRLGSVD